MNWAQKRDKKRQRQQELERNGGERDGYEINQYTIGSDRFNEYYKVSRQLSEVRVFQCRVAYGAFFIPENFR